MAAVALHVAFAIAVWIWSGTALTTSAQPQAFPVQFVTLAPAPADVPEVKPEPPAERPQEPPSTRSKEAAPLHAPPRAIMPLPPTLRPEPPTPTAQPAQGHQYQLQLSGNQDEASPATQMKVTEAPAAPTGAGRTQSPDARYLAELAESLRRAQRYPIAARRLRQEGRVVLKLDLAADGALVDCEVVRSSGYELLDEAALDMVRRTAPLPPSTTGAPLTLTIPIVFSLNGTP
jgi:protein TonB